MDNAIGGRRVLAVVPAYNERDNIVSTIEDLRTNAPGVDYVIVNDGSKDDTLAICREHGYNVIDLPVNLGLAGAFQTGMRYAYEQGYDYAVQFDADGQHSAAYIEDMVALAERNHVNIVIGSRFNQETLFRSYDGQRSDYRNDSCYHAKAHSGPYVGYAPFRQDDDPLACKRARPWPRARYRVSANALGL